MKISLLAEAAPRVAPSKSDMPDLQMAKGQAKSGTQWNAERPAESQPLPSVLNASSVEDVVWDAPGRAPYVDENGVKQPGDPRIGVQIGGVRKTKGGYVYNGWWYVLKQVHKAGDKIMTHGQVVGQVGTDRYYWYRRRRDAALPGQREGKVEEAYVGKVLKDPDSGQRIIIPDTLKDPIDVEVERAAGPEMPTA